MADELLSSKVVVREVAQSARGVPTLPTAILGIVGVAERGPLNVATLVTSFGEYRRIFGGYLLSHPMALAVKNFFDEGGQRLYVVRVCHAADVTDPTSVTAVASTANLVTTGEATKGSVTGGTGPFNLEPNQTLVISVDAGGDLTATFTATAASRSSMGGVTFNLADGDTIIITLDGRPAQTITVAAADVGDIDAVTRAELARIINASLLGGSAIDDGTRLYIRSDTRGTSSSVAALAGTAAAAIGVGPASAGGGNVANIDSVTHAEVKSIVEGAAAGTEVVQVAGATVIRRTVAGAAHSVRVKNTSTATAIGFDNNLHSGEDDPSVDAIQVDAKNEGTFGDLVDVQVAAATSGEAYRFNLIEIYDGRTVRTWPNLSFDPDDPRYFVSIVNDARRGSDLIALTDLGAELRPANQTISLAGGDDGLVGLVDADFLGGAGAGNERTGLRALDLVLDLSLAAIPGKASSALHNGLLTYCETTRGGNVFAILDPPADQSATEIITYVESTASLLESSEFGAIYWPRLKVANPDRTVYGTAETVVAPPSGIVCGVISRVDAARPGGIYDSPAGLDNGVCRSVLGFESDEVLDEAKRDLVYPKRINPIRTDPGAPKYIDGGRTLKSGGNFPNISERRGVIYIRRSLKAGLQFARHLNNDESLQARARRTVTAFLLTQMRRRAFRTQDPTTAFYVACDEVNNPPSAVAAGELHVDIGLATAKPAEFVVVSITQDTRALDAELAAAGA